MTPDSVPVDGVTAAPIPPSPAAAPRAPLPPTGFADMRRWKGTILMIGGTLYACYVGWSVFLMAVLPDPSGRLDALAPLGIGIAVLGAVGFLVLGGFGLLRISAAKVANPLRVSALIIFGIVVAPGILLSVAVLVLITREPKIALDILKPTLQAEFVAPLSITFSAENAVEILGRRDLRAVKYIWDFDGDGKPNEETVIPTLTVMFDREGLYTMNVKIVMANGAVRRTSRRFVIEKSVFSVVPLPPIVGRPVIFGLTHLLDKVDALDQVQWDFNGDGVFEETTKVPEITNTFFNEGKVTVTAMVRMKDNVEMRYERTIEVQEPAPLPFPALIVSEPERLIGPPPFGVLLRVKTDEPLAQVTWTIADRQERLEGERMAYTFEQRGSFPVIARIRSESGVIVELTTVVRVVEELPLPDLTFDGPPDVNGQTITGEVPMIFNLRPRTAVPFVQFFWETPEATQVTSREGTLQAVYRREGKYNLTLVAQDAQQRVMRKVFRLEVLPPVSVVNFTMRPESGVAPLRVAFDASETFVPGEDITGYEWSFGDRSPLQTGSARIEHVYQEPGTYDVDLTVRTISGKEQRTSKTIVVRPPVLNACALASRSRVPAGGAVRFDMSCSVGKWSGILWDFGDGAQTDGESPVHVFDVPGSYTVTLTLRDSSGRTSEYFIDMTVTEP